MTNSPSILKIIDLTMAFNGNCRKSANSCAVLTFGVSILVKSADDSS